MKKTKLVVVWLLTICFIFANVECVMAEARLSKSGVESVSVCDEPVASEVGIEVVEDPAADVLFAQALQNGSTGYPVSEGETISSNAIVIPTIDVYPEHLLTEANVRNVILSMRTSFPEGMVWTNDNGYRWNGGVYLAGYGCAGFVFMMSDAAFGKLSARSIYSFDWDNFRVGDILRVNNNGHSVIILEKYDDYVIVAEGNYGGKIHWGRKMTKSDVQYGFSYYMTRYPADGSVPNVQPALNAWTGLGSTGVVPQVPTDYGPQDSDALTFSVTDVRTGGKQNFNSANGYPKVLVFGGIGSCGNTSAAIARLSSAASKMGLSHTELWAFDIQSNSDSKIAFACANYQVGSNFKVVNQTTDGSQWRSLYYYLRDIADEVGLISDGILYMPLIVYVDGQGKILDMTVSSQAPWEIESRLTSNKYASMDASATSGVTQIEAFVSRLYTVALGRGYDQEGLEYWCDVLKSKKLSGAQVAANFFFCKEMDAKHLSNEEFLKTLYLVMMDRTADQEGMDYWLNLMNNGYGREGVFKGFVKSKEFNGICASYGINPGDYQVHGASRNAGLSAFMSRLYTKALGRDYDKEGIDYWCDVVLDGRASISDVSTTYFFECKEFLGKNLNDRQYLEVLYRTFFDREYDQEGMDYWMGKRNQGMSRGEILRCFEASKEFKAIKARYGF